MNLIAKSMIFCFNEFIFHSFLKLFQVHLFQSLNRAFALHVELSHIQSRRDDKQTSISLVKSPSGSKCCVIINHHHQPNSRTCSYEFLKGRYNVLDESWGQSHVNYAKAY
jgi:hypothetical protein